MTKARDLANLISGGLTANEIPDLPASKITSGTIASARLSLSASDIPTLDTAKITSGTFADARLASSNVTQHVDLSSLNASNLTSGTVPSARLSLSASDVPDLATSKITSGTFADARLSSSSVTQHVDLSNLNASNLTSGSIPNARVPSGAVTQHVSAVTNTSGTWTPSLYTASANFSASTVSSTARYVRVGDLVFCSAVFQLSNGGASGGNSTDTVYMGGLPFTSANVSTPGQGFMRFRRGTIMLLVQQGNTTATLVYGSVQGGDPYSTSGDGTKRGNINEGFQTSKGYFSTGFLYRV